MEIQEILAESSRKAARRHAFFNWIAPTTFFLLTVVTTLSTGSAMAGEEYFSIQGLVKGLSFALASLFVIGSHAFGHYITARLNGVSAYLPYFVPGFRLYGSTGAYTKMKWPIHDRNSLICIFTIGPITGFCASWLLFLIGLNMSQIIEVNATQSYVTLGDSLITFLTERMVFGYVPDNKDILLHPIAYAGWMGLYWNCWHLLPIGKFDGGRILYALYGFKRTKLISYCSIFILLLFGFFWDGWWIALALIGILCIINVRGQYPAENYIDEIQNRQLYLSVIALIILIISFPVPIHVKGI